MVVFRSIKMIGLDSRDGGSTGDGRRVLIIDDDPAFAGTLFRVLKEEGYSADVAYRGGDGLEKSKKSTYDAFIIDIVLPDLSGTVVLARLRDAFPHAAKVMISGYPFAGEAVESLRAGADAYIIKPFDVRELLNALRRSINLHKARSLSRSR